MDLPYVRHSGRRAVLAGLGAAITAAVTEAVAGHPAAAAIRLGGVLGQEAAAGGAGKRQLRGLWIASLANIDWPRHRGLSAEQLRADFVELLDQARMIGFNAVFVEVRPTADAFWPSPLEPWSQWLTGTQGQDPGWDPLAFMVDAAHERGLAFHAWFNPFRVAIQPDRAKLLPSHPARRSPEWAVVYNGEIYYDPGIPAVREFVQRAIMDAVSRYDIDGVHFDDYFYPYPAGRLAFPDAAAFAAHGQGFTDRAAWRRNNIDLMVRQTRDLVRAARPEAVYGVSPFGVWRNARDDPAGSDTTALVQSYDSQYSDTLGWARKGWVDYLAPQLYWFIGYDLADYAVLAPWWAEQMAGTDTQLWIGQSASRPGAPERPGPWQDPAELSRHLAVNATLPAIGGDIFFSARSVQVDRIGAIRRLAADHWQRPVLGPLLPRLAHAAPPGPPILSPTADLHALRITPCPRAERNTRPFQYAVYRYDSDPGPTPPADPTRLTALLPALTVDQYRPPAGAPRAWYAATSVDRAGREGPTSTPLWLPG
ncbi:glycoside hydrolase family 10 protein [Kitasatospora sp. GAS1066B]|uniref:glycoside hydrolase family 10 protein n=1 Tax=Kitasatospora sp. GAS1066B TaxID=3156271 RepID=UPI00351265C1